MFAYVSAIQDISLSPVLMSGAGTSMPGPVEQRQEGKERERERGEESLKKKKEKEYNITNSEHQASRPCVT